MRLAKGVTTNVDQKKIVITGGAGFIGSQLGFELYKQGWEVVLLDNLWAGYLDNLVIGGKLFGTFLAKDVRDPQLPRHLEGADVVCHLAGIAALPVCQSEPQFAFDVNTSGTANVLEAVRRVGVRRVIFSSTSAVYECNVGPLHKESDPVSPNLVYSTTKLAAERVCRNYALNYGMDIVIARFFNVYGPHQDFRRKSPPFTSYIARELHAERTPILFNQSNARRDYVHAKDVIRLLIKMIESEESYSAEVFNVGSGQGYSVPELYGSMARIAGKDIEPVYKNPDSYWNAYDTLFSGPYPMSAERVKREVYKEALADTTKTEKTFSWKAEIDIGTGLASVYEYASQRSI